MAVAIRWDDVTLPYRLGKFIIKNCLILYILTWFNNVQFAGNDLEEGGNICNQDKRYYDKLSREVFHLLCINAHAHLQTTLKFFQIIARGADGNGIH